MYENIDICGENETIIKLSKMAVLCKDPASLRRGFVPGHAVLKLLTCASAPDMSSKFSLHTLLCGGWNSYGKSSFPFYSASTMRVIAQTVV